MIDGWFPFLWTALLYWALGRVLARWIGAPWRGAEGYAWSVALGTGGSSLVLFGIVAAKLSLAWFAIPVVVLWIVERMQSAADKTLRSSSRGLPWGDAMAVDSWAWPPLAVGLFLVLSSLAMETGEDALAYHLPAAQRLATGGAGAFPGLLDAEYRLGFDVLWSPGLAWSHHSGHAGTAVLHAMTSTALCAAVFSEIRRRAGSAAAGIATTLLLASSAIADYAILGFVDHAVALYGFLALSAASKSLRGERGPWAILAGALAGFAANAKLSGAAWIVATAAAFFAGFGIRRGIRPAVAASAAGATVALPFVLRSWIVMGNPFFPAFANSIGSGWANPRAVEHASRVVLHQTGIHPGPLLGIEGTVRAVLDPASGFEAAPWILAFLLAAALIPGWTPARRGLLAGAAVAWAAWAWFVPILRFGMGAWAWAAVAAAVGAARLAAGRRPIAIGMLVAAVALFAVDLRVVLRRSAPRVFDVLTNVDHEKTVTEADREANLLSDEWWRCGRSTDALEWMGGYPHAMCLSPVRNGVVAPEDFTDPDRLRRACRRLCLRSLSLAPPGRYGYVDAFRRAAEVWAAEGTAVIRTDASAPGWWIVGLYP